MNRAVIACFWILLMAAGIKGSPFTVRGNITVNDPTPPYSVGEEIKFNFTFNLNGDDNVTGLVFKFTSDTLMFLPEPLKSVSDQFDWFYDKAQTNGSTVLYDRSSSLTFTESFDDGDWSISVSFPFRGWASEQFFGRLTMVVRDTVGPGRRLSCLAQISYTVDGDPPAPVNREIESEITFSELPKMALKVSNPVYLKVLQSTSVQLTIDLPQGVTDGTLQVVMPLSVADYAPQMSVADLQVDNSKSISPDDIATLSSEYACPTIEGLNDVASVSPISVSMNGTNSTGNELEFGFTAQAEIYRGIENGSEILIGGGLKFGNSFLWVAEIPVYLLDDYDRKALLRHNLTLVSQQGYDGEVSVTVEVDLWHDENSTDHAYDVDLLIYLMPVMTSVQIAGLTNLGEHGSVLSGNRFILTMSRIRLGTSPGVQVNISIDATDDRFSALDEFILVSELFYVGGYRNSTENSDNLRHVTFHLDKDKVEQLTYTSGATCTCNFDTARTDCGCCRPGGCQCGVTNPGKCTDCRKPWRCASHLQNYERQSNLDNEYVCRAYQLHRPLSHGVSCYRQSPPGTWTELSPVVGVILGKETSSGTLYGLANNGDGYVVSTDNGQSWASVSSDIWTKASTGGHYASSTFTDY